MTLQKLPLSLSPAQARGFSGAPFLYAAPQSGDLLSGNRGEGVPKNPFFRKARQISIFDAPSLQLPLFSDLDCQEYPTAAKGQFESQKYPTSSKGQNSLFFGLESQKNPLFRKVDKCRLLVSGFYVIPGQTAMDGSPC